MGEPAASASPYVRAQANLSTLGLDGMAAALPDYVRAVSAGEPDLAQALAEMTESEVTARRERITRLRIRSSGLPCVKTLADFDWSFQPSVPRPKLEELATLRFVTGPRTSCSSAARASARPTWPSRSASRPSGRAARSSS